MVMRQKYHIARNNQKLCLVDKAELIARVQSRSLLQSDLYWTDGMSAWKTLSTLSFLTSYWGAVSQIPTPQVSTVSAAYPISPPRKEGGPACCPNCGNKNIKTAKHLYLTGTRDSTTTGSSFGWGRRSSPRTWASSRTSSSRLAAEMAPPQKGCGFALIAAVLVLGISVAFLGSLFSGSSPDSSPVGVIMGLVVGLFLAILTYRGMSKSDEQSELDYQKKIAEWERIWYCNKCSNRFLW
jgi:hypothetical protein